MPFGSEQWMYASGGFYPHEINQSLRFNDDDSAYLSRTPASAGNRKTWTWSGWVKRGNLGIQVDLFGCQVSGAADVRIGFLSNNTLYFYASNGTTTYRVDTNAVFRDVGSWYHIFVSTDTTQATEADRVKVWVNGVQQTLTEQNSGYPPQNYEYPGLNTLNQHNIGIWGPPTLSASYAFDGYLAEINFVDGTALDPTDFGETKSGVWIPKEYTGTYGTNGFHLDFGNSGSLGADVSGNGNNWTTNNLASTDQMLDSPTNNFCTYSPVSAPDATYSEGNLRAYHGGNYVGTGVTMLTGLNRKYYAEQLIVNRGGDAGIAVNDYANSDFIGWIYNGNTYGNLAAGYAMPGFTTGDIIGFALDGVNNQLQWYKNGVAAGPVWQFSTTNPSVFLSHAGYLYSGSTRVANFGQDSSFAGNKTRQGYTDENGIGDFYYEPPAGYLALCTANLPDPVIDPAEDDIPADYFNTVLWTGDGTSPRSITGVGFQPDFVWTKRRSDGDSHHLFDVVRGTAVELRTNTADAELTSTYGNLSSYDSDGFTVTAGANGNENQNKLNSTVVAWNWKAGGTAVANTDGTIASQVSANQKAGFSIVSYTGNSLSAQTIGHGLSKTPELVISKSRDSINTYPQWMVYHKDLPTNYFLLLNATNAQTNGNNNYYVDSLFSSSVFGVGNDIYGPNVSPEKYIAYCFHSVDGYSKFGSYTGNGSTDGPFVYTGFRPAFVMIKRTDASGYNWLLWDTARDPENTFEQFLYPNLSNAEDTVTDNAADSVSNGFKVRSSGASRNASGGTYIYMAFAEMPFKYSNAR